MRTLSFRLFAGLACVLATPAAGTSGPTPRRVDPREAFLALVPEELHEKLGLDADAIEHTTFLHPTDVSPGFHRSLLARLEEVRGCVGKLSDAWVAVPFDREGAAGSPRAAVLFSKRREQAARCLEDGVAGWHFDDRTPGPAVVVVQVFGRPSAAPSKPDLVDDEAGLPIGASMEDYTKPRLAEPGCVVRQLTEGFPSGAPYGGRYRVKFAVSREGKVRWLHLDAPAPPAVGIAMARAVRSCTWIPGTFKEKPIAIWVLLPIAVGGSSGRR